MDPNPGGMLQTQEQRTAVAPQIAYATAAIICTGMICVTAIIIAIILA